MSFQSSESSKIFVYTLLEHFDRFSTHADSEDGAGFFNGIQGYLVPQGLLFEEWRDYDSRQLSSAELVTKIY